MNSRMFNSFLDGTKSAIEMAAIANATGLTPPPDGLRFPPCGKEDLAHVLRPAGVGGQLHHKGQVEVVSSLERDGRPVPNDLRWGVYVVIEAPNDYTAACFRQYGMNTDATGRYSAMYKPFHLIGLELNMSILAAGLLGKPTGATSGLRRGRGGHRQARSRGGGDPRRRRRVHRLRQAAPGTGTSLERGALPIGLAHGVALKRPVGAGEVGAVGGCRVRSERRRRERRGARWRPASPPSWTRAFRRAARCGVRMNQRAPP